jgi:hypothetical protein
MNLSYREARLLVNRRSIMLWFLLCMSLWAALESYL